MTTQQKQQKKAENMLKTQVYINLYNKKHGDIEKMQQEVVRTLGQPVFGDKEYWSKIRLSEFWYSLVELNKIMRMHKLNY